MKNIFKKSVVALFVLSFVFGGVLSSASKAEAAVTTFTAATNFSEVSPSSRPYSIAKGDFNGDGFVDVVVSNIMTNDVSVYLGNGNGGFGVAHSFAVGAAPTSVEIGDFNADGKLDLVTSNALSNNISILLGNGDGTFGIATSIGVGAYPYGVAIGDFNGDNKLDLVTSNTSSNNISILLGNGNGTFNTPTYLTAGLNPRSVAIADFNADGKSDIVVANELSNNVSILLGNGNGTFNPSTNFITAGGNAIFVATGDLNADGKIDLAVADNNSNISILLGNGNGTFGTSTYITSTGKTYGFLAIGDLNADGILDIAAPSMGSTAAVSVYLGKGAGLFNPAQTINIPGVTQSFSIVIANLNGDNQPDLVVGNYGSYNISVLLNTTFSPPDTIAPTGSITINSNAASTNSTSVTLNLSATDIVGVTGYFASETPATPTTLSPGWVTVTPVANYNANIPFIFSNNTNGDKTVYAWYKDAAGNISTTSSDSITLGSNGGATPTVAAGIDHYLDLKNDGTVWAWGSNDYGQLGNGTTNYSGIPVKVNSLTGIIGIEAGSGYSLALKNDGTVWAWGQNAYGEIGNGTTINSTIPVQVTGLTGVTAIATGSYHSLALKNDGTVWTWGRNDVYYAGQLGNGTNVNSSIPVQVCAPGSCANGFLTNITAIEGGGGHSLALKSDGTVWAWGWHEATGTGVGGNVPSQVKGVGGVGFFTGVTSIAAGLYQSYAVKNDGTAWAWGRNNAGEIGIGTTIASTYPAQIHGLGNSGFLTDVKIIKEGDVSYGGITSSALALKNDGSLWAWGQGSYGALGDGTNIDRSSPVRVCSVSPGGCANGFLNNIVDISSSGLTSVALKNDGSVLIWGSFNGSNIPVQVVGLLPSLDITAPAGSITINSNAASTNSASVTLNLSSTDAVGVTGYFISETSAMPTNLTPGWIAVASTTNYNTNTPYTFLNNTNGTKTVYVWYKDTAGNISGTSSDTITFNTVAILSFPGIISVAGGGAHSLALEKNDLSSVCPPDINNSTTCNGQVWSWGDNAYGALGNGTIVNSSLPVTVNSLTGVTAIAGGFAQNFGSVWKLGGGFSLALKSDGTVWAWGSNSFGQLGNGTNTDSNIPVQVNSLTGITAIATGGNFSLALRNDGTVLAWGTNGQGQLGNGTIINSNVPVQVSSLTGITAIAGGGSHAFALKNDGRIWAWGYNGLGELGTGNTISSNVPILVSSLTGITAISGEMWSSLALKNDGTVWGWGRNAYGELGNGTTSGASANSTPMQVHGPLNAGFLTGITAIGSGERHSLSLKDDGSVWVWGWNGLGQLGNGTIIDSNVPVQVNSVSNITSIAGGYWHSLALKNDGSVLSWGNNGSGQLGNGNIVQSNIPVLVLFTLPDTTAPTGSFTINNNVAYTDTTAVTLNLFAADTTGIIGYFISEFPMIPSVSSSAWVAITPTTNFNADVNYSLSSGDGTKTIYVWYKDAAGNISGTSTGSSTTILDTTSPTTNISSQLDNSYSKFINIDLSGTSSDATLVSTMISVDGGAFVSTSGTASAWTYSATSLSEGVHTFQSQATDALGNITLSSLIHVTVDTTAPVSTTESTPSSPNGANGWYNSDAIVTFSATDNFATNQIKYCVDKYNTCTPSTIANVVNGMSTTISNEGINYVRYSSSDLAGNIENVKVIDIDIDKTAPTASSIVSNLAPFSNQDNVTITWSIANDMVSGVSYYQILRCEVSGSTGSCTPTERLNLEDIAINGYDDSSVKNDNTKYFYSVKAVDMAGNQSSASNIISTIIDKAAPLPPTLSAISPTGFISSLPAFLTWSAAQDPGILASGLDFYRLMKDTFTGSTLVYVANLGDVTSYSDSITEGTRYFYKVRGVDKVANEGANSNERSVVLDQTKPTTTISINPVTPDGTNGWYKSPLSFTLGCADLGVGETSGCQASGTTYSINGGTSTVYTGPVLIDQDGTYTITYSSVDNAGNTEDSKTTEVIKLDQTAPVVAISSPADGTLTNQNSIDVAWSVDGVDQTTELTEILTNEGINIITRAVTDEAGNVGTSSVSVTRDTVTPNTIITSSPTDPSSVTSASFVFVADDTSATSECNLDGAGYVICVSPVSYSGLSTGSHTFSVQSTDQAGNVEQTPATFTWNIAIVQNSDTDGDGVLDNVDLCPTVPGKVFRGCPFSDITKVTTHIAGANSTGDCGVDKKGKKINECTIPTVGAIVKVFDRDNINFSKDHGKHQLSKKSFNSIFESDEGFVAQCTTDSTGSCTIGEDHGGKYIVIAKVTDGVKVAYDGKYKEFKKQSRGSDDSDKDDNDSNDNKPVKMKYFTITKNIKFNKVINNKETKYTSEAGDSFEDSNNKGDNKNNQNNNKVDSNKSNQNNNNENKKSASLWGAVQNQLASAPTDTVKAAVKEVAKQNDIAIPEWGISGTKNSRSLTATIINALDLSFLSSFFR